MPGMCDQGFGFSLSHAALAVDSSMSHPMVPPMAILRAPETHTGSSEILWSGLSWSRAQRL